MELSTILQVVLPAAAFGILMMGGASSTLGRVLRIRRRPFRWARHYTAAAIPRATLVHREPVRLKESPLPSLVGRATERHAVRSPLDRKSISEPEGRN